MFCKNGANKTPVRLNVNGYLLPIRLKSEPETVHVHAHGLTLVYLTALEVISTAQCRDLKTTWRGGRRPAQNKNFSNIFQFSSRSGRAPAPPVSFVARLLTDAIFRRAAAACAHAASIGTLFTIAVAATFIKKAAWLGVAALGRSFVR